METPRVRAGSLPPSPTPSIEAAKPAPTVAVSAGDRYVSSRPAEAAAFERLGPWRKAWMGLQGGVRQLPSALWGLVSNPVKLLEGMTAPLLHPVRSVREAQSAVREASAEGPLEAALAALKGYGGLLSAWGLPLSIALAPFTGGASLIATVAMGLGTVGMVAMGASLAKNVVDAAHADSPAELDRQSQEISNDGLGLVTAAATVGAAKLAHGAMAHGRPVKAGVSATAPVVAEAARVTPPAVEAVVRPIEAKTARPRAEARVAKAPEAPKPKPVVVAEAPKAPAAAIVRRPLPEHPAAMEAAVSDQAAFYQPPKVNYMPGLLKEAGFDGLPTLASAADLDRAIAEGALELHRGVANPAHANQFREGELFIGMKNANGSGTWVASGSESAQIARRYAPGSGVVMRMALKPGAKVTTYQELTAMLKQEKAAATAEITARREALKAEVAAAATPDAAARLQLEGKQAIDAMVIRSGFRFEDLGRYGVLKGYDAIDMGSTAYMNVLNRTALIGQETNAAP
ncbi:hypothetical protein D3C72_848410 [compost metagenome]